LPGGQIEGTVVVCVDLQNQVLARFRTAHGQARWLWLERGWRPERWPELRRALHARARKTRAVTNDGIAQTQ
jgi:hypothetical protein